MSLRSAGDDVVSRIARLLELEGDRWRPHRALELLSFVLGDRAQVGDASRYIFAYARHRGYDLPPYPLAGCGEIRAFFADEGVRNVPDWYGRSSGSTSAPTRRCRRRPSSWCAIVPTGVRRSSSTACAIATPPPMRTSPIAASPARFPKTIWKRC